MKIETRDFGILEIEEKNIITFKQPIFGFEEFTQFVLVNDSNMGNGICWLQSIEQKSVCFIMLNPLEVRRDYAPVVHASASARGRFILLGSHGHRGNLPQIYSQFKEPDYHQPQDESGGTGDPGTGIRHTAAHFR